jgi:hypothetical protein
MRFPTFLFSVLSFVLASQATAAESLPIRTPYAQQKPLAIRNVSLPATTVDQWACLEMTVDLDATYDNPFDSSDIAIDAAVTLPNAKVIVVPGFYYRDFERKLDGAREVLTPRGEPSWRVRFAPTTPGEYSAAVIVADRSGRKQSESLRFHVAKSNASGFVRVSPRDRRYFEFDNGKAFYPIGLNICWAGSRGSFDYDAWIPAFAKAGCNTTRFWLAPGWNPFALERAGKAEQGLGMGQFDLGAAWRLDRALDLAQREGLYVKLCIDSYNILRQKDGYPYWDETPHNAAHGGPLAKPADFWTDPAMERFYRDKLRYLVARYTGFTHVLAWEFWNEVDIITDYRTQPVRDWHARNARYLRSIDPYSHLITTSFANSQGDPQIDRLPELDYVQTHLYGGTDPVVRLAPFLKKSQEFGKPHYVGEVGADAGGSRFDDDPQGIQVHDPIWLSLANGASGGAQVWYWELVHSRGMHPLYSIAAKFAAGIDWPGEQMQPVAPRLTWAASADSQSGQPAARKPVVRKSLVLETSQPTWTVEGNRPQTVRVARTGVQGDLPLAGIQHGVGGHKDKHNPVRFETDLPWSSKLVVNVGDVSGWGGASLAIRVDGRTALTKQFANTNPPDKHDTLRQYCGDYGVEIPAGRHVVEVENRGNDWFYSGYEFTDAIECVTPPLLAWATAGRNTVLAWVRLEARTWRQMCVKKVPVAACDPSVLTIPHVAPGRWRVELWNTWSGKTAQAESIDVAADGEARIPLPKIDKDLAVRLTRESQ